MTQLEILIASTEALILTQGEDTTITLGTLLEILKGANK